MDIPYIPYFTTSRYRVQAMIELAEIQPGERAADLGTGDGRIAIALAKAGAIVDAYELDDERIKEAKENIEEAFGLFSTSSNNNYSSSEAKPNREVLDSARTVTLDAIAFGQGDKASVLKPGQKIDIVYTIAENEWNGKVSLQLKVKDIRI